MSFDHRYQVPVSGALQEALEGRVKDGSISLDALEAEAERRLQLLFQDFSLPLLPGMVISSTAWTEFLRDEKFYVNYLNLNLNVLEREIGNFSKQGLSLLSHLEKQIEVMDADISERELKSLEGYDFVHFNSFVREIDQDRGEMDDLFNLDPKTDQRFLKNSFCNVIPGVGLTLPVEEYTGALLSDVVLRGELTDVGDTNKVVFQSSPRALLSKNKVFKYVVVRKEAESNNQQYVKEPSYITVDAILARPQMLNHLRIAPAAQNNMRISSIEGLNMNGESLSITARDVSTSSALEVFFEPVMLRRISVTLEQTAPLDRSVYVMSSDLAASQMNELFEGVGFDHRFPVVEQEIQGRVFDFSLKGLQVGLYRFKESGIFRSKDFRISGPVGLSLMQTIETLQLNTAPNTGGGFDNTNGVNLVESYVALDLKTTDGRQLLNGLIPVPDSYNVQSEVLVPSSYMSRVKLFPDLSAGSRVLDIVSSWKEAGNVFHLHLSGPHGLPDGTHEVLVSSQLSPAMDGMHIVTVVDATTLSVPLGSTSGYTWFIPASAYPKPKIITSFNESVEVRRDGVLLTPGLDYDVTLDGGAVWHADLPVVEYLEKGERFAGDFAVRLKAPDFARNYSIKYTVKPTQWLHRNKQVRLKNGSVLLQSRLRKSTGRIAAVMVMRAQGNNEYVSPTLRDYYLRVN